MLQKTPNHNLRKSSFSKKSLLPSLIFSLLSFSLISTAAANFNELHHNCTYNTHNFETESNIFLQQRNFSKRLLLQNCCQEMLNQPAKSKQIFSLSREKDLKVEAMTYNMFSNILLCLAFCFLEMMYAQWTSWPTFPKHLFKLWCSLPKGCFLPTGCSLPKWCFLPKKFHETNKKQIGMEVSKNLAAELKNKPRKRISSKKMQKYLFSPKSTRKKKIAFLPKRNHKFSTNKSRKIHTFPQEKEQQVFSKVRYINNLEMNESTSNNRIILLPTIKKKKEFLILDCGAELSCASQETYEKWKRLKMIDKELSDAEPLVIRDAQHGELVQTTNPVIVTLTFDKKKVQQKFYIIQNLSHTLLGCDFLRSNYCRLYTTPETVQLEFTEDTPISFEGYYPNKLHLHTRKKFLNPGINELTLEAPFSNKTILHIETKLEKEHPIQVFEGITRVEQNAVKVVVYNKSTAYYPIGTISNILSATPLENNVVISRVGTSTTTDVGVEREFDPKLDDLENLLEPEGDQDENLEPSGMEVDLDENYPPVDIEYWVKLLFPPEFHEEMIRFFTSEYPNLIAQHSYDSGTLNEDIMVIKNFNMRPGAVVKCKPLRLDHIRQQQLNHALEIMVKSGILIKGVSAMYSPAFIISKSDGRIRVVISYILFNRQIEPLNYTIPDTRQVLLEIGKANPEFMSTIDFSAAYSAIKVRGEASKQAAICTQTDTYLLRRLLFGISTSPGLFAYAMSKIIETIDQTKRRFVSHFFDDVTIYSGNWPEMGETKERVHLECIKKVLIAVHKAGLKINIKKCQFFQTSLNLLGRTITKHGISPQQKTVDGLFKIKKPHTLKQLQSIIGGLVYLRDFVINFSHHMAPIFKLLRKDEKLEWGEEQEKALDHFKEVVTTKCINYFPNFNKKLYIACDASDHAVGAILYQVKTLKRDFKTLMNEFVDKEKLVEISDDNLPILPKPGSKCPQFFALNRYEKELQPYREMNIQLKVDQDMSNSDTIHVCLPIAFHSETLGPQRSRWNILEKEVFAVCSVIDKFEDLIEGFKEVYVLSDSSPFLWIAKKSESGYKKLQRWIYKLAQSKFTIFCCSISSKQNVMADLLSRSIFWSIQPKEVEGKWVDQKVLVKSPFPFNSIITIKDIISALKTNPNCVYQAEAKTVSIDSIYLNFAGTSVVQDLQKEFTDEKLIMYQQNDDYCKEIMENLDRHKTFYIYNGLLFKKRKKSDHVNQRGRIVLTELNVAPCIIKYHFDNHCAVQQITDSVNKHYFYPGMYQKVLDLIGACHLCTIYKGHSTLQKIKDHPFWPISKFYVWHLDVLQAMPIVRGYRSILVMQEYYTKFKIVHGLRKESAEEIARCIEQRVFSIFNPPKYLSSDGGSNLLKAIRIQKLLKKYNVKPHIMTAYHPQSHGTIEICCKAVQTLLRLLNDRFKQTWPSLLGLTQILLNNKKTTSLGNRSPYYAMFGVDQDLESSLREEEKNYKDYNQLEKSWVEIKQELDEIIDKWNKQKDKQNEKIGGKFRSYPPGSWVFVRDHTQGARRKLRARWQKAPLLVVNDYDSVLLVKSWSGIFSIVHKKNCYRMKSFKKEEYFSLPAIVRANLGVAFTNKELQDLMEKNEMPKIFQTKGYSHLPKTTIDLAPPEESQTLPDPMLEQETFEDDEIITPNNSVLQPIDEEDEELFPLPAVANADNQIFISPNREQLETIEEENEMAEQEEVDTPIDLGETSNENRQRLQSDSDSDSDPDAPEKLESRSQTYSLRKAPKKKSIFDL